MTHTPTRAGQVLNPCPTVTVGPDVDTVNTTGYVNVSSVVGVRPDGTLYDHVKVQVGAGYGVLTIPIVRVRGLVYVGLVRQHRPVVGQDTWEFPRGGATALSPDEAARELAEETRLDVAAAALRHLGVFRPDTGILNTEVGVWVAGVPATSMRLTDGHLEDESGATVSWVRVGRFAGMIMNGEVTCSMSITAYTLANLAGVFHEAI